MKDKEQTPIKHRGKTLEEWREYVKKDNTSNVRTMKYVWVLEELLRKEQERTNAKVLEALEKYEDDILQVVEKKADVKDYILRNRSKTKV